MFVWVGLRSSHQLNLDQKRINKNCVFPSFKAFQTKVDLSRAHRVDSGIFMKTVGKKYFRDFSRLERTSGWWINRNVSLKQKIYV